MLLGKRLKSARGRTYSLYMTDTGINIFYDLGLMSSETGDMVVLHIWSSGLVDRRVNRCVGG
jgi:hypothetical protein